MAKGWTDLCRTEVKAKLLSLVADLPVGYALGETELRDREANKVDFGLLVGQREGRLAEKVRRLVIYPEAPFLECIFKDLTSLKMPSFTVFHVRNAPPNVFADTISPFYSRISL